MGTNSISTPVEWHPGALFGKNPSQKSPAVPEDTFNLLVLNVPLYNAEASAPLPKLWTQASVKIAADGGANRLHGLITSGKDKDELYSTLDVVIGDLDSLHESTRSYYEAHGTEIIHDRDQESTDFGKAISYLRQHHERQTIVALGGLGGRVDQGLSQLHHLYLFQQEERYSQGQLYLVSEESVTFLLKAGGHRIRVRGYADRACEVFGKHVGIVPIREPSEITTGGLEWDVTDWRTEIGGRVSTSNHVLPETEVVEVRTTKDVLFTIALNLPAEELSTS